MPRHRLVVGSALLLLTLGLTLPAHAAPRRTDFAPWLALTQLWARLGSGLGFEWVSAPDSMSMDPNGRDRCANAIAAPPPPAPTTLEAATAFDSMGSDPNGRPNTASPPSGDSPEYTRGIDPNG
jgi:hypothetical protein